MVLKIKHLQFPRTVERPLKYGFRLGSFGPTSDITDWTLEEFFEETSPAMILVGCRNIGKIKFRKLVRFLLEIDENKTIKWINQNPDVWDWQTPDIKKYWRPV